MVKYSVQQNEMFFWPAKADGEVMSMAMGLEKRA
jgi:hypothetical protein